MKVVLATKNRGKFKEFVDLAGSVDSIEFEPMPDDIDPKEVGATFLENAIAKARVTALKTKMPAVADDSGLEVDALGGRPGVHSARYCQGSDADRREKLLAELEDVPDDRRQATFVCAMALCSPSGDLLHSTEGRFRGRIGREERGDGGFGYDAIFYLRDKDKTVAELPSDEKNAISHRGQAWRKMVEYLKRQV